MKKAAGLILCVVLLVTISSAAITLPVYSLSDDTSAADAADTTNEEIAESVLQEVTDMFADVYTISEAMATINDTITHDDGSITYIVDVSFKRTLKAATAEETSVIQALQAAKSELNSASEIAAVDDYINSRILDLEGNYIGVAQDTTGTFQITLSPAEISAEGIDNAITIPNIEMVSEFGDTTVPAVSAAPVSTCQHQ